MLLDALPASDSAEAHHWYIRASMRLYFRDSLPALWQRRRAFFLSRYLWKALDDAIDYDIARYCRGA